jgi:hypothetical protein
MKKFSKIMGILFAVILILAVSGYIYMNSAYPKVEKAPNIKINTTPEMLARGSYLFNSVCGCVDCHSQRDLGKFTAPVVKGTEGMGGMAFDESFGLPGIVYAKNITPANLGNWTDGEIFRAITMGVDKDGGPLFPFMPYPAFGRMDKEDIYAIIAYLRTLKPIPNDVPKSKIDFPMSLIMRTIPEEPHFQKRPDPLDKIASGKYLLEAAGCSDCHTQMEKGKPKMDMYLAGGWELPLPGNKVVRVANITSDMETGIGKWTKEQFINRFKQCADPNYSKVPVKAGEFNTYMPWTLFANMTEEDLGSIYEYLRTVKSVKNQVEKFGEKKLY